MILEALEEKSEIPLIVIISVSVCGTLLLCLNIVLISCFVHKKKQKEKEQKRAPSSEGKSNEYYDRLTKLYNCCAMRRDKMT